MTSPSDARAVSWYGKAALNCGAVGLLGFLVWISAGMLLLPQAAPLGLVVSLVGGLAGVFFGVRSVIASRRQRIRVDTRAVMGGGIGAIEVIGPAILCITLAVWAPERTAAIQLKIYALAQINYMSSQTTPKPMYAHEYGLLEKALPKVMPRWSFGEGIGCRYALSECSSIGGKPIDWSKGFALCATPRNYGWTHRRTFLVVTSGEVWAKNLGHAEFVSDVPKDLSGEGWQKVLP